MVEITQIASYGCRGRNGNNYGNISEHAFGNALDIAGFRLANGEDIVVVNAWGHGTAREQAFLQAVFAGACAEFYTVLGPGSDSYHYNHIHVDLLVSNARNGRHFCQPSPAACRWRRRAADPKHDGLDQADPIHRPCAQLTEKLQLWPGSPRPSPARPSMIGESGGIAPGEPEQGDRSQVEGRDGSQIIGADA